MLTTTTCCALASSFLATRPNAVTLMRPRVADVVMLDVPMTVALGTAAVGVAALGFGLSSQDNDSDSGETDSATRIAELQNRIRDARTSTAVTYRERPDVDNPEPAPEAQLRRERVLLRAQSMLDEARQAVQEGLDEAILNEDYDTAEDCLIMLEKMKPLPTGIDLTTESADYKRWLDSSPRRA